MKLFLQAIIALPQILKFIATLIKKIEEANRKHKVELKVKDEIKEINEAIKNNDPSRLDKLWK